jgi:hypothetical protein
LLGIWLALAVGLLAVAGALLLWVRRTARRPIAELQVRVNAPGALAAAAPGTASNAVQ